MADTRHSSEARELERISALRATLVITHAFWASLLLPMRMRASSALPTFAATDCVSTIWINPEWTTTLTMRQLGYILLHEVGHVAFLSALRRGPRDHHLWNEATDLCINSMLDQVTGGTGRPLYDRPADVDIPGVGQCSLLTPPDWAKDLAAEQIYERLAKEQTNAAHPQGCPGHSRGDSRDNSGHAGNHSENQQNSGNQQNGAPDWSNGHCNPGRTCMQIPIALSPNEAEDLIQRVQAAHEAWVASSQRGTMPAGLARFIDRLRVAKVPWQRVLHQYAGMALAKEDFSLLPPHRRWLADADIIRPSCRSTTLGMLVLAVDTSGSISRPTLEAFAAEMAKLHTLSEETLILTHDAEIQQAIPTAKVADFLRTLQFKGGGGTSHEPVFEWLRTHRTTPDLLVGLTDLYSAFPTRKPPYPVLWCAPEQHGDPPPWGRLVVIPESN